MDAAQALSVIKGFEYRVIFDVLAVAWLVYRLLLLIKGTRAMQVIASLMIFFGVVVVSDWLRLYTLNWILRQAFPLGPVALVILFLPELRHALEEFGRPGFWGQGLGLVAKEDNETVIDEVVRAVNTMSVKRIGALIVFERENGLEDIIHTGTMVNADVTSDLLGTVFYKGSPLHDGAVILREDKLVAAGCTLPLTSNPRIDATVHTRHKAAMGITEQSDAIVVVVSEETGTISISVAGKLIRGLRDDTLKDKLLTLLQPGSDREGKGRLSGAPIVKVANRMGDALKTAGKTASGRTGSRSRSKDSADAGDREP